MADSQDLERRVIYRGKKIDLALQTVSLADGSTAEREVVIHRGAVALLPMVSEDHVCLIMNHRYTIQKRLLEVPAGTIDPGESPDLTAGRELTEETGYSAGRMERVAEWWVSPGVMNERMYLYVCRDLVLGQSDHQLDEQLEPVIVPWKDAVEMVLDGRIDDAKSMLAILWHDRARKSARN